MYTSLIRYIANAEADMLFDPSTDHKHIIIDGSYYTFSMTNYVVRSKKTKTTVKSYLSSSMGVGSNIVGFLDATAILHGMKNMIDVCWLDLQNDVTSNRTSMVMVADIEKEKMVGGFPYTVAIPEEDDELFIPPPTCGLVRMRLGGYLPGGGNPYEVNFMSAEDVVIPAFLLRHVSGNGVPLSRLDVVAGALEMMKKR